MTIRPTFQCDDLGRLLRREVSVPQGSTDPDGLVYERMDYEYDCD